MVKIQSIVIYIFIADYFVNEIFGDNMITPVHDTVHSLSGPLFSRNFLLKVDENTGMSEIIGLSGNARDIRSGHIRSAWGAVPVNGRGIEVAG